MLGWMGVVKQFQNVKYTCNRMLHARQGIIDKTIDEAQGTLFTKIGRSLLNIQYKAAWFNQQTLFNNFNGMGINHFMGAIRTLYHQCGGIHTTLDWA